MSLKSLAFVLEAIGLLSLYSFSYIASFPDSFLSMYGAFLLGYFGVQTTASLLNQRAMKNLPELRATEEQRINDAEGMVAVPLGGPPQNTVLLVVGHRENPLYWEMCLRSVLALRLDNLAAVYIYIDGNTEKDRYMHEMVDKVFQNKPTHFPSITSRVVEQRGKRGLLYMGIEQIRFDFSNRADEMLVVATDSDTVLSPTSLLELEKCIRANPKNGCATGILGIYNLDDGLLPKIIHARYYYAFAIERAALSWFGCMTCCSGPLSIYRLSALTPQVMKRFHTQEFLSKRCEPGDDRHLTNIVMAQGYRSRQTNQAVATTEAPSDMTRFLLQQLRWSRSYYRELYWQIKSIPRQSFFLGFVTVYETVFPYMVLVWILNLFFWPHPAIVYLKAATLSAAIMVIRTFIMWVHARDRLIWYNLYYYFLYFLFLLPTKFYAGLTITNNAWVTQTRDQQNKQKKNYSRDAVVYFLFLGLYQATLLGGLSYAFMHLF